MENKEKKEQTEPFPAKGWNESMRRSLIAKFATHRCLFDPAHPGMKNRVVRTHAYKAIARDMEAEFPGTTHLFQNGGISRQYLNLKTYYYKLKKTAQCKSGDGADDVVDITWSLYGPMENLMRGIEGNTPSLNNYKGSTKGALSTPTPEVPRASSSPGEHRSSLPAWDDEDSIGESQLSPPSSSTGSMVRGSFPQALPRTSTRFDDEDSIGESQLSPRSSSTGSMLRGSFPQAFPRTSTRFDDEDSIGESQLSPRSSSTGSMLRGSFPQALPRTWTGSRFDEEPDDRGVQPRPLSHTSAWMSSDVSNNPSHPPPAKRRRRQAATASVDPRQEMYASITSAVRRLRRNSPPPESSNTFFCRFIEKELDKLAPERLNQVRQKILQILWGYPPSSENSKA